MKEEKPEEKDLLADLQDISDSERKTSTAESSIGNWRAFSWIFRKVLHAKFTFHIVECEK